MTFVRRWRKLAMAVIYFNVGSNLLLFAVNPAWGSMVLAWVWLLAGFCWTGLAIRDKRRSEATARRHEFLMRPQPRLPDPFRQARPVFVLQPGERIIPIPQVGGVRKPQVPARESCNHRKRDAVRLSDGTTVAYICRSCDRDWADENYVSGKP